MEASEKDSLSQAAHIFPSGEWYDLVEYKPSGEGQRKGQESLAVTCVVQKIKTH